MFFAPLKQHSLKIKIRVRVFPILREKKIKPDFHDRQFQGGLGLDNLGRLFSEGLVFSLERGTDSSFVEGHVRCVIGLALDPQLHGGGVRLDRVQLYLDSCTLVPCEPAV